MSGNKDRLKSGLTKGPRLASRAVTAHSRLVPDLSATADIETSTSTTIATNDDTGTAFSGDTSTGTDVGGETGNGVPETPMGPRTESEAVLEIQLRMMKQDLESSAAQISGLRNERDELAQVAMVTKEQLEASLKAVRELESQVEDLRGRLSESHEEISRSEMERADLLRQLEEARGGESGLSRQPQAILREFGVQRLQKQFGQKKGDTYKQVSYYQDHDITARLDKFLKHHDQRGLDKSLVINAALDFFLNLDRD